MENRIEVKTGYVQVTGTDLYYELRGHGPYLVLIPAGGGDSSSYENIAGFLSKWYTVITYDRRGYSRSKLKDPEEVPTIETHADDVCTLLDNFTKDPAYVYGNSAGGVIAFDLLARYPERILKIMFSEPAQYLTRDSQIKNDANLGEIFKKGGFDALMKVVGIDFRNRKPAKESIGITRQANMEFFFNKEVSAVNKYVPKFDALEEAAKKVKILIGGSTTAQYAHGYRGAVLAAEFFHKDMVYFPGDHGGYENYPEEYAEILHDAFELL